ncbi:uncharacterized protein [Macrobrachium rosenbergii]|uniref:uncharacterized protein n=1 Tax=Macrobrachium rosenbergii TaxID=79674 RepID=UPI0034D4795D
MDVAELLKTGQSLGLTSDQIGNLIELEKQEREQERVIKRRELEAEEKRRERDERAAEREAKKFELEMADRDKLREHELALAKLNTDKCKTSPVDLESMKSIPKIPCFVDGQDEMDAYLSRFEKLAVFYKWKKEDYAYLLGTLLRGRALRIYIGLPSSVSDNYDELKLALLKVYHIDVDSYRKKFKESVVEDDESYIQLVSRMENYLSKWVELSGVNKDYDSLSDLLIRDQLLSNCPKELRVFFEREKYSKTLELAEAADRFMSAHGNLKKKTTQMLKSNESFESDKSKEKASDLSHVKCHQCGKVGHIKPNCYHNPANFKKHSLNKSCKTDKVQFVFETELKPQTVVTDGQGSLFDKPVQVMLDTGASSVIINDSLIPSNVKRGKLCKVYDYLGVPQYFPKVRCYLNCKFFKGWVSAIAAPIKFTDVLLGLVPGVSAPGFSIPDSTLHSNFQDTDTKVREVTDICMARTRAQFLKQRQQAQPLQSFNNIDINVNKDSLIHEQEVCPSLVTVRDKLTSGEEIVVKSRTVKYEKINGLVYRTCVRSNVKHEVGKKQLVIPKKFRTKVLNIAHESILAGHFSHRKTSDKVFQKFFWPGASADIIRYCRSCVTCQKFGTRGSVKKVPMKEMPIVSEPFSRIAVDLIGPISPTSDRGHRYILTVIDCATRFPEAIPLRNIDTITVAEGLVEIFCRVGIPREILTDQGSQFKSDLMAEINRLLSIKALFTTPYHAACNWESRTIKWRLEKYS